MLGFPQHICDAIPQNKNCSHTEQYPDNFSKLMHLMNLSLQMPLYYNAFKSYCEGRPALRKYITQDVSFTNEMMAYVSVFIINLFVQACGCVQVYTNSTNIFYNIIQIINSCINKI